MCDSFALQSGGRCETCLCRIRPMRSFLKHFCMALIRPGDIMQIPANVPRITDEHHSLSPSPMIPLIPWWENCRAKSNEQSTWTFRSFTQRAREQDNLKQRLMEFSGPFWNRWLYIHIFLHITFIAFIAVSMETAEHFEASTDFPSALRGGGTDVMPLRLINYKCCMCVNIQTFGLKLQGSLEAIQIGHKWLISLITSGLHNHKSTWNPICSNEHDPTISLQTIWPLMKNTRMEPGTILISFCGNY